MIIASVWGIYYKAKRLTKNIDFIKKMNFTLKNFYICFTLITILQAIFLFFAAQYLFGLLTESGNQFLFLNKYLTLTYQLLFESYTAVLILLILYIAFVIYTTAMKIIKYQESSHAFLHLFRLDGKLIFLVSFIEETIWEMRNIVSYILPAVAAYLSVVNHTSVMTVFAFLGMILISIFLGILVTLIILNMYNRMARKHYLFDYFCILGFKISVFMLIFYFSSFFSSWFNQIPIQHTNMTPVEFNNWLDSGFMAFQHLTHDLSFFVPERMNLIIFLLVYVLISVSVLLASRVWFNRGNAETLFLKNFFSSMYTKIHFKYFSGSLLMWMNNGLIFGLLVASSNEKVEFFLLMSLINYSFFYYLFPNMDDFSYIYLLDGEGKKVTFWKFGKMIRLLNIKMIFHTALALLTFLPFLILFFLFADLAIHYFLLSIVYIFVITMFYFILTSYTTVIFPYFNYENLFELKEQVVRKKFFNIINSAFLIVILPSLLWPFAFYFSGDLTKNLFILYSFIIIPIILTLSILIMKFVLNRKISSESFQRKIFNDI